MSVVVEDLAPDGLVECLARGIYGPLDVEAQLLEGIAAGGTEADAHVVGSRCYLAGVETDGVGAVPSFDVECAVVVVGPFLITACHDRGSNQE